MSDLNPEHTQPRAGEAPPLRVLFLCTQNSARSQIAEALLARKGHERFVVASAGTHPARSVHPFTVAALREYAIDWSHATPRGLEEVGDREWDLIITVCDRARENCPTFPGRPVFAHWGMGRPC